MSRKKAHKLYKRPYATLYYRGLHDKETSYVTQGAASTPRGAVRATVVKVFADGYPMARVYDKNLVALLFTVRNNGGNLRVEFADESANTVKLRRVK